MIGFAQLTNGPNIWRRPVPSWFAWWPGTYVFVEKGRKAFFWSVNPPSVKDILSHTSSAISKAYFQTPTGLWSSRSLWTNQYNLQRPLNLQPSLWRTMETWKIVGYRGNLRIRQKLWLIMRIHRKLWGGGWKLRSVLTKLSLNMTRYGTRCKKLNCDNKHRKRRTQALER